MIVICWFRQDLRLSDNPAFFYAASFGRILPVYIINPSDKIGAASKWWLHYSLQKLNEKLNNKLLILKGDPIVILPQLIAQYKAVKIHWNRCYEPHNRRYDDVLKNTLPIEIESFNGSLLWEPNDVLKPDGTPYKVFTHFYQSGCLKSKIIPRKPLKSPSKIEILEYINTTTVEDLQLLPIIRWDKKLEDHWVIGETAAQLHLIDFLDKKLHQYKLGRDFPALDCTSKLSPHLHFGEISPNQIWYAAISDRNINEENLAKFLSEIAWREFSYSLLYHFPSLQTINIHQQFDHFPWQCDDINFKKWCHGETGFPLVDAGMRELWMTGYMHNRVRMVAASFLVKNLLIDWRYGEQWFGDCLVDADMANNAVSWQWVTGCGVDAAPYYRIFNPIIQAQKFDHENLYITKYLSIATHKSQPIIELHQSRIRALAALKSIKFK